MSGEQSNRRRSVLISISVLSLVAFLIRQIPVEPEHLPPPPPPPPVDEEVVDALSEISDVAETFDIPFTGSFCQNLMPGSPELSAEWRTLRGYQTDFIAAAVSENLELVQSQFQPILDDPDAPILAKYLALTKTAWIALRSGQSSVAVDALERLESLPQDEIRDCYKADIPYIRSLLSPGGEAVSLLKQAISLNPLHVPAYTQLVSRRIQALQNESERQSAFADIVQSMTVLRKVSGAQIFATRLTANIPEGSCQSAECQFIRALLFRWSNANAASQEALQSLDLYCLRVPCPQELLVVSAKLQNELSEVEP